MSTTNDSDIEMITNKVPQSKNSKSRLPWYI